MTEENNQKEDLKELLKDRTYLQIPKIGDLVKGIVLSVAKNEIKIDLPGYRTGVVRGNELYREAEEFSNIGAGNEVEATVVDLENENGDVELSFKFAGRQKTWAYLDELKRSGKKINVKISEANKGGLIIKLYGVPGFIPVSQLSPDNYPRVQGGDKGKILERLRSLVGKELTVKILDAVQAENKLIASEKLVWDEDKKENIAKFKVGDIVEGEITAVTNFGVFLKFSDLEGLIHISELAWQRIDNPQDLFKVGDKVRAMVVNIQGSRIFLSIKRLQDDPWKDVEKKYQINQKIKGKVLKASPFGLFVELDKDIHGLAHITALGKHKIEDIKEGDEMEFVIISLGPKEHRLGLSLEETSNKGQETGDEGQGTGDEERKKEDEKKKESEAQPQPEKKKRGRPRKSVASDK